MKTEYEVKFSLNLANVFPEVGKLTESVNAHMSNMGYSEKLTLRSRPICLTLTTEREMTDSEIDKMKDILTAGFIEQFIGSNPVCESFRRKPGNVSQSVVQ